MAVQLSSAPMTAANVEFATVKQVFAIAMQVGWAQAAALHSLLVELRCQAKSVLATEVATLDNAFVILFLPPNNLGYLVHQVIAVPVNVLEPASMDIATTKLVFVFAMFILTAFSMELFAKFPTFIVMITFWPMLIFGATLRWMVERAAEPMERVSANLAIQLHPTAMTAQMGT